MEKKIEALLTDNTAPAPIDPKSTIFVVHGRDKDFSLPFKSDNTSSSKVTTFETDHWWRWRYADRSVGKDDRQGGTKQFWDCLIATPDDVGYLRDDGPPEAIRARQNVIMEMGMLLASLTRRRCAILTKGFVELPSNMGAVITIPFNDHVRETVPKVSPRA